jgi:hypothetical protein
MTATTVIRAARRSASSGPRRFETRNCPAPIAYAATTSEGATRANVATD